VKLIEIARLFLKLGLIGFGGPTVHISMMEHEVVEKRGWLTRQHFLDLLGATNLIPGPNSTEMALHVGYVRAGFRGLLVAGLSFILPAVSITTFLAWLYVQFGTKPQAGPFLFGIQAVVVSIVFMAVWKLGQKAVKGAPSLLLGAVIMASVLLGVNEVLVFFLGSLLGWIVFSFENIIKGKKQLLLLILGSFIPQLVEAASESGRALPQVLNRATHAMGFSLTNLGLFFLKVGSILYGSGYVLVAYLEGGLVQDLGWLSSAQLMDAIGMGQVTPGPVLSTSAFVGYLLGGIPGAAVSAFCIFIPSFFFVALLNPYIPKLRQSKWASKILDAVNISALSLMAAVTIKLGMQSLSNWPAAFLAAMAAVAGLRWKANVAWLVLGGAACGWIFNSIGVIG